MKSIMQDHLFKLSVCDAIFPCLYNTRSLKIVNIVQSIWYNWSSAFYAVMLARKQAKILHIILYLFTQLSQTQLKISTSLSLCFNILLYLTTSQ